MKPDDPIRISIEEMLTKEMIRDIGADHEDAAVCVTRICGEFRRQHEELTALRDKLRGIGDVYIPPSDWDYPGQGGPPPIEAYEKIDLTDL